MAWQPEKYRPVLKLMARRLCLDRRLQRRFDSSDLVQQTLLQAHARAATCRGQEEAQRLCWLHTILVNAARDRLAADRAARRDASLEVSLNAAAASSSACLEKWLAARQPSPAQEAERQELLAAVARAIDVLPDDQGEAILRHHLLGESTAEVAAQMGRTPDAVKMLLYRGMKALRERLQAEGVTWP
jgi:RNA polymerase sigma-70 factor (ECF subfamily)